MKMGHVEGFYVTENRRKNENGSRRGVLRDRKQKKE